jgi:hypothetical protein
VRLTVAERPRTLTPEADPLTSTVSGAAFGQRGQRNARDPARNSARNSVCVRGGEALRLRGTTVVSPASSKP